MEKTLRYCKVFQYSSYSYERMVDQYLITDELNRYLYRVVGYQTSMAEGMTTTFDQIQTSAYTGYEVQHLTPEEFKFELEMWRLLREKDGDKTICKKSFNAPEFKIIDRGIQKDPFRRNKNLQERFLKEFPLVKGKISAMTLSEREKLYRDLNFDTYQKMKGRLQNLGLSVRGLKLNELPTRKFFMNFK